MRPFVYEAKCIGCGACVDVCPVEPKVMELRKVDGEEIKSVIVHPEVCDFGGACVRVCPTGAFRLIKD